METYKVRISEGHITGYGVGPISDENTLIKFVITIARTLTTCIGQLFLKKKTHNAQKPHQTNRDTTPLFI